MGIIRKQTFQASLFIYIGFAVGALNVLVLFPNQKYFTLAEFGLTKVLVDVSLLIAMMCTLGTYSAVVKFYPFYNSYLPKKKNDLPVLTISVVTAGCLLFLIVMPFLKDVIIRKYGSRSPLFVEYFYLIFPMTISIAFLYLFEAYSWAVRKSVLPAIAKELFVRLLTTVLIFLVMWRVLNFSQFINLYAFIYVPAVIFLVVSLARRGDLPMHFQISSVTKRLSKRIIVFSLFLFSGQALNILARTLDSIIISSQSPGGLQDTGIFTIATYFIALMEVPVRGMIGIAFSVLAQAWKDKNRQKVFEVYKKTALNLLIAGFGLFGLIVLNMENIISFLGPDYKPMTEVVIILGVSKLIDLGTGLNSHLLLTSKHWRIEFVTNIFLVLMAGIFNYLLVRKFGIVGSAWATLVSFAIYNGVRFLLIKRLFDMQPFGVNNLYVIVIASLSFGIAWWLPKLANIFLDSLVRSAIFGGLYSWLVFKFNLSPDITEGFRLVLRRFVGRRPGG